MKNMIKAKEPFRFYVRLHLSELTGLKAATLEQLLSLIRSVPDSCIYQHTHRFLQAHQYLSPEPTNDFAYWVSEVFGERELGDRLLRIDTVEYSSLAQLRQRIALIIGAYTRKNPLARIKFAKREEEFNFIKTISFIFPTEYLASDLNEFKEILRKVSQDSFYFHIFDARLRLGRKTNDFSDWMDKCLGEKELAGEVSRLDPYTQTLEGLRSKIVGLIETRILD